MQITLILLIVLLFAASAAAIEIPFQITSGPSVQIAGPGQDASSSAATAHPGEMIKVIAGVSFKYLNQSGMPGSFTTPAFPTSVYVRLYKDGEEVVSAYQVKVYQADSITIKKDETRSVSGTVDYAVPADLAPGVYVMRISASADPSYMGITYSKTSGPYVFLLTLMPTGATPTPTPQTVSSTPIPTPQPGSIREYNVSESATRDARGNLTLETDNATLRTADGEEVISGAVEADLGQSTPTPGEHLTIRMQEQPTTTAATQFMLASSKTGQDISGIAGVMVIEHPNMTNGKEIKNATITMKVSPAWVEAHGGIDQIRIMRYSDGKVETLETVYQGTDSDGLLVFTAVSPHGLSEFALVSVGKQVVLPEKAKTSGAQVSIGLISGAIVALLILVAILGGGAYVVMQKRKKK